MEPIKVLIVDDSALMRRIIHDILAADPRFVDRKSVVLGKSVDKGGGRII